MEALAGFLFTVIPLILTAWLEARKERKDTADALAKRSLSELHAADDRMRGNAPVSPK